MTDRTPNFDEMYPSKWLKASDLTEVTELTIRKITMEILGEKQETKPVLYFKEPEWKPMVCNKTNGSMLHKMYGETVKWIGQPVRLYATTVEAFGEVHDAIRIQYVDLDQLELMPEEKVTEEIPF